MSDQARLWSRCLRGGLSVSEHAVCRELGEYHNSETNLCFPSLDTICDIYECSRIYLGQLLTRLENWQLIVRIEWFEDEQNRQTSNRFRLNLARHFPDPFPEGRQTKNKNPLAAVRPYDKRDLAALFGAAQGRKYLRMIHNYCRKDETLVAGIKEAFLEKPKTRVGKKPQRPLLWVAIESDSHERKFKELRNAITAHIVEEELAAGLDKPFQPEIRIARLFYKVNRRKFLEK